MRSSIMWMAFALLFTFNACKKDANDEPYVQLSDPEALSPEEIQILDGIPEATGFSTTTVVLPNGETLADYLEEVDRPFGEKWMATGTDAYNDLGPQDARNLMIARLAAVALNLTDRSKHQFEAEGDGKPAQNGIAYSWGSKDYTKRQVPPGDGTICNEAVYGLDASGFIFQLFAEAGVPIAKESADKQRQPDALQQALKSAIAALDKVKVEDLGAIPTANFEAGDIIYWTNSSGVATHIGLVLKNKDGKLAVFQSNGAASGDAEECAKNLGDTRGARRLQLNDPYWFGQSKPYAITRINAEISGNWNLFLRCSGSSTDAITLTLEFPTSDDADFKVTGTGIDYDGKDLAVTGDMHYDNTTNVLSGTTYITAPDMPHFYRYDSFSVKLSRDNTSYFDMELGENVDAGCAAQGRLRNNE